MKQLLSALAILLLFAPLHAQPSPRVTTSLNGEWTFHRDGSKETKTVTLPTHWETHEGLKFDGIGWYETTIELPDLKPGRLFLLHFNAFATHATVYWNDKKLGEHLGAWPPFRFDVTEHLSPSLSFGEGLGVRGSDSKRKHTIKIRVDEKVGHNTQGFLPIIAPHFGGIWQGIRLIEVPETYINDLDIKVSYDNAKQVILAEVSVLGTNAAEGSDLRATVNISKGDSGSVLTRPMQTVSSSNTHSFQTFWNSNDELWSPIAPRMHGIVFTLKHDKVS